MAPARVKAAAPPEMHMFSPIHVARAAVLIAVSVLTATACTTTGPAVTPPVPGDAPAVTPAHPVATFDARIEELMRKAQVPGLALALVRDGRIVHQHAYGFADVDAERPLTIDTVM
ncbi:MAG: serine hydrolase [Acidobacteria bacterium]|nr:serine hydrolase [Acidobacteriota bacterium]